MEIPDHDPFAPRADDRGAVTAPLLRTVTLIGPLAQRDPRAVPDETGELAITGDVSLDDLLVRARRGGFVTGLAAGSAIAAAVAAVVAFALSPEAPPSAAALPTAPIAPAAATIVAPAPPAPALPVPARRPAAAAAQRTSAPSGIAAVVSVSGLDLRGARPRSDEAGEADEPAPAARVERAAAHPEPARPRRLEEPEVAAALAERHDAIDACVAATDPDGASAGRRLLLVVSVEPSGKVSEARIDDAALEGTALGRCVASVARDMSFRAFGGGPVEVELPVQLAAPE